MRLEGVPRASLFSRTYRLLNVKPACACIVVDCRTANDPATINKESTNENNTVGLMLAGCGSTENHVRNHGVASTSRIAMQDRGNGIAVDTICACP